MNRCILTKGFWSCLVAHFALTCAAQVDSRAYGLLGYDFLEPAGFNRQYAVFEDAWGEIPIPVIYSTGSFWQSSDLEVQKNLPSGELPVAGVLSATGLFDKTYEGKEQGTMIQSRIAGATVARLDGGLALRRKAEGSDVLLSANGRRQRLPSLISLSDDYLNPPMGQFEFYGWVEKALTSRLAYSMRSFVSKGGAFNTESFVLQQEEWLYGNELIPMWQVVGTQYPVEFMINDQSLWWPPGAVLVDEAYMLAQRENVQSHAMQLDFVNDSVSWKLNFKLQSSDWHQRAGTCVLRVLSPLGKMNMESSLTRTVQRRQSQIEWGFHGKRFQQLTGLLWATNGSTPAQIDAQEGAEFSVSGAATVERSKSTLKTAFRLDANSLFGLRPTALIHYQSNGRSNGGFECSLVHGWRMPNPLYREWSSYLNPAPLIARTDNGLFMPVPRQLPFESATYWQSRWWLTLKLNNKSVDVQVAPLLGYFDRKWNHGMVSRPDPESYGVNVVEAPFGIAMSHEGSWIAGGSGQVKLKNDESGWQFLLRGSFNCVTEQKAGTASPSYAAPRSKVLLGVGWASSSPKRVLTQWKLDVERIGKTWVSFSEGVFYHTNIEHDLDAWFEAEDIWAPGYFLIRPSVNLAINQALEIHLSCEYAPQEFIENHIDWDWARHPNERPYGMWYEPNYMRVYAPLAPLSAMISMKYTFQDDSN